MDAWIIIKWATNLYKVILHSRSDLHMQVEHLPSDLAGGR